MAKRRLGLIVNGRQREAEIDVRLTLAEFLREVLGLTGTKVGCNRGECGSCTVVMDGKAVYSCSIPAVEAAGKTVLTIEGLAEKGGKLHPIQEAFLNEDALQCGFCTPGMIMSAKALLDSNPTPTETEIKTAVGGNLCRCGCFQNIVKAVSVASGKMAAREGSSDG